MVYIYYYAKTVILILYKYEFDKNIYFKRIFIAYRYYLSDPTQNVLCISKSILPEFLILFRHGTNSMYTVGWLNTHYTYVLKCKIYIILLECSISSCSPCFYLNHQNQAKNKTHLNPLHRTISGENRG